MGLSAEPGLWVVGWVNLNKSSRKVYGAHIMVFYAQFSNFIEFGSEMRQRNDPEVCSTRVINENQSCPGKVLF